MIAVLLSALCQENPMVARSREFNERLFDYVAARRDMDRSLLKTSKDYELDESETGFNVYSHPAMTFWSRTGKMWGWSYALYLDDPQNNLTTPECIALAKEYYRFLGGKFELVKRNGEDITEAYRPQYVLLEFDKVVPGTDIRVSSGFVASIDVTYGIPLQLSGLYEPPLPPPAQPLGKWRIEDSLFVASRTAFGWWQSDNAVAPNPVYVQTGDTYRLVYDCTSYDPSSWSAKDGRFTTYIVYRVDAVTSQVVMAVPSWATGGPAPAPTKPFTWSSSKWGFGKAASKFAVKDAGQVQEPKGRTVRLSNGKTMCQAVWSAKTGVLATQLRDKWISGKPEGRLRDLLNDLPH